MHMPDTEIAPCPEMALDAIPQPDLFSIDLRHEESCDLLVLAGQIDQSAAPVLLEVAIRAAAGLRPVEVDWREAERLGPGPVQILLSLASALSNGGRVLAIRCDNPRVRGSLELAGLFDRFTLAEDRS